MSFKKNTAVTGFPVHLISSTDGSDITTGTPVGYYLLDGGTQTAIGDVTPVHEGNGQWTFDLTTGEMNGDIVGLLFTHASAITAHFTIKTDTKIVSELNDIAATAIVSGGAINTTTGAVDNVTLVATTTNNTDMRGTDSANTTVPDAAGTAPTAVEVRQEMDSNSTQLASILADTASFGIVKNATFSNFEFPMVLTSDHYTAATSKTVTGEMSIDGGAFASTNGTIAEVSDGIYQIDLTADDTNGDFITYKFSATACDDTIISVTTRA